MYREACAQTFPARERSLLGGLGDLVLGDPARPLQPHVDAGVGARAPDPVRREARAEVVHVRLDVVALFDGSDCRAEHELARRVVRVGADLGERLAVDQHLSGDQPRARLAQPVVDLGQGDLRKPGRSENGRSVNRAGQENVRTGNARSASFWPGPRQVRKGPFSDPGPRASSKVAHAFGGFGAGRAVVPAAACADPVRFSCSYRAYSARRSRNSSLLSMLNSALMSRRATASSSQIFAQLFAGAAPCPAAPRPAADASAPGNAELCFAAASAAADGCRSRAERRGAEDFASDDVIVMHARLVAVRELRPCSAHDQSAPVTNR